MKQIFLPITIAMLTAVMLFSSCTVSVKYQDTVNLTGEIVKKPRKCEKFNELNTQGGIQVIYIEDDSCYLVTECDKAIEPMIDIEVKDSVLKIALRGESYNTEMIGDKSYDKESKTLTIHGVKSMINGSFGNNVKVFIHAPKLNGIKSAGYLHLEADKIQSDSIFQLKTSGASDVDIDELKCATAIIHTTGSSNINAEIEASEDIEIKTAGSSYLDIECINCGDISINTAGSCAGEIKGDAKNLEKQFSGAMSLDSDNLRTR